MKVDGVVSEDIFDYLFDVRAEKFLSAKDIIGDEGMQNLNNDD